MKIFHWRKLGIFIFDNHPKRDHKLLSDIQHNLSNWSLNLTICLTWKRFINSSFTNSLYKALIVDFRDKNWYSKQKKLRRLNVLASFGFGLVHCKLKDHVTFLFPVTCFDLLCYALWFLILPLSYLYLSISFKPTEDAQHFFLRTSTTNFYSNQWHYAIQSLLHFLHLKKLVLKYLSS